MQVEAFSINRGETFLLERPRRDWRPGRDVSGRVVRALLTGAGQRPASGSWVIRPRPAGPSSRPCPSAAMAVLPDQVDVVEAAALPLAGLTALRLLRASGAVAGLRVLLTGASGGVGHYVTELASAAGAAVSGQRITERRALLALGAADVVRSLEDAVGPYDVALSRSAAARCRRP